MTSDRRFLPLPLRVVVVLPSGGQLIGVMGLYEAFEAANRILASRDRPPLYTLDLVGVQDATRSAAGPVLATAAIADVADLHTLVVGGALEIPDAPVSPELRTQIARLADAAERVVGVCMGTFVLGDVGLLDGRRCTTHWLALQRLRECVPAALVEDDALYTEDGRVWTSAGASAGIDLALQLIRRDGGPRLALSVAQVLVMFAHRPGGQSQFGSALRLGAGLDDRMRRLVAGVIRDPAGDHRVAGLAARAGMSPRNFARVFRQQTGETPAAFVTRVRVEAAQRLLVSADDTVASVAADCGFGSEDTLRRTFLRVRGVTPTAYRARFAAH
ncbi:MAG: helix-turn-helix domain-containing protein [Deltaproteobacteria bacterium]|nr:helix-turn-helix domain-containing protein [Deltaproteobacteria bacterium]